ncbi:LysR family transcriptional regulator [Leisingera sp. S132]|uniref:LysR family transcriptional regulator n=1 Tax=Leisingera sp. S132 TaxID=2867016 RepID=UPI0021A81D4A|nr:LysR family transcriptional regulator [Leisingera sp. S132]UWQ79073.1 LysR family transcriptional regulator [Leisingera sp. S132]
MRVSSSDINSLNVFRVVVESGGFTGAQHSLNISQSSVSAHIAGLEERLGFRLCERGRSGFSVTKKGAQVYAQARKISHLIDELSDELGEMRNLITGHLKFGMIDNTISDPGLPLYRAVRSFVNRARNVEIDLRVGTPRELEASLLSGDLNMALTSTGQQVESLTYEPVYEEMQSLYCSVDHPLFDMPEPKLADAERHAFVARRFGQLMELRPFSKPKVAANASNMEALAVFILSGHYIGFLPRHYAERWVQAGKMRLLLPEETSFNTSFFLVTRKDARMSRLLSAFADDLFACINKAAG